MLDGIHHAAVICSDYDSAKAFYVDVLGLRILAENYQAQRDSYKIDLALPDGTQIELFIFKDAPERPSYPEALGLRHLAFAVTDLAQSIKELNGKGVQCEEVREDPYTGKRFTFFSDPDGLPLELYEQ